MALQDRKIPILTGVNDIPSSEGQSNHPNDSLLCKNYNDLIDNELTTLSNTVASLSGVGDVTATARQAISVTGNATYDSATGLIDVTDPKPLISSLLTLTPLIYYFNLYGQPLSTTLTRDSWKQVFTDLGITFTEFITEDISGFTNQFEPETTHTFPIGDVYLHQPSSAPFGLFLDVTLNPSPMATPLIFPFTLVTNIGNIPVVYIYQDIDLFDPNGGSGSA